LVAGKVTTCCFDKTGTLTETHLDFSEYLISEDGKFKEPIKAKETQNRYDLSNKLFATCHSITSNTKGETFGDPLDLKMFEASGFILKDVNN
jgi:magnesium-transporting ATPase (P-type)